MTDLNSSLLNDKFNLYYDKAKKYHANGDFVMARRNYLLAAEALMKLAKNSSEKLKASRIERARRLASMADSLGQPGAQTKTTTTTQTAQKAKSAMVEQVKQWQAATVPNITFDDVVGLEEVKRAIAIRMINPIKYPEKYKLYNKKSGGGVLLYGPPGTGKTMIAKAIANEVNAKFYVIKGSDIVSKWVGESEKNINALFEVAKQDDLAIIFIDEMDSLIGTRGLDPHNDKRVNEFLQQIDGFASKTSNLLLLGATNRPWDIDLAAMRSGRFSQKIYVPLPDKQGRKFLFEKFTKDLPLDNDVNIDKLVEKTINYSGADIEEVCERAKEDPLLEAIKTDKVVLIKNSDFEKALKLVRPTVDENEIKKFEEFATKK
jgi:transitional endoplasmic reticulum ATPase